MHENDLKIQTISWEISLLSRPKQKKYEKRSIKFWKIQDKKAAIMVFLIARICRCSWNIQSGNRKFSKGNKARILKLKWTKYWSLLCYFQRSTWSS